MLEVSYRTSSSCQTPVPTSRKSDTRNFPELLCPHVPGPPGAVTMSSSSTVETAQGLVPEKPNPGVRGTHPPPPLHPQVWVFSTFPCLCLSAFELPMPGFLPRWARLLAVSDLAVFLFRRRFPRGSQESIITCLPALSLGLNVIICEKYLPNNWHLINVGSLPSPILPSGSVFYTGFRS